MKPHIQPVSKVQIVSAASVSLPPVRVAVCGRSWVRTACGPQAGRATFPLLPMQLSLLVHRLSRNSRPWGRQGGYLILWLLFSALGLLRSMEPSEELEGSKERCLS